MDSIEIVWIYYGFSGVITIIIVWISHFFPVLFNSYTETNGHSGFFV